jgi:cytidine deaminase
MNPSRDDLLRAACEVRLRSHSPYSHFRVGAALLCRNGRIITGTNVENVSFGLSICAERAAVFRAIAEGESDFVAIAICADGPVPTPPCGACRQVLLEFGADLEVIMGGQDGPAGPVKSFRLLDLLPEAFVDFNAGASGADGRERT